jgi:hypothetical protein
VRNVGDPGDHGVSPLAGPARCGPMRARGSRRLS